MKHTEKMVLVPYQDGGNNVFESSTPVNDAIPNAQQPMPRKRNNIREYAMDRQRKILSIILKLAQHGGYDAQGMTKLKNDEIDIVPLLLHVCSPGRSLKGMDDFIDLLIDSGVTPDLIINANIRDIMDRKLNSRIKTHPTPLKSRSGTTNIRDVSERSHGVTENREVSPNSREIVGNSEPSRNEMDLDDRTITLPPPPPLYPYGMMDRGQKRKHEEIEDVKEPPKSMQKTAIWDDHDSDIE